jgi:hypothetical protein
MEQGQNKLMKYITKEQFYNITLGVMKHVNFIRDVTSNNYTFESELWPEEYSSILSGSYVMFLSLQYEKYFVGQFGNIANILKEYREAIKQQLFNAHKDFLENGADNSVDWCSMSPSEISAASAKYFTDKVFDNQ